MTKTALNVALTVSHKKVGGKAGYQSLAKLTLNGKVVGSRTINGKASDAWVKKELRANPGAFVTLDTIAAGLNAETLASLAAMA